MTQNRSHAVMAQRIEANDSLDFFPTPPWATRALCEHVIKPTRDMDCWEPACGTVSMVWPLAEYFGFVTASDVHNYDHNIIHDFLQPFLPFGYETPHWIITNPPFRLGEQFIERAMQVASVGVAMLVRTSFLESVGRYVRLFKMTPPTIAAQFVERVPMLKGRLDRTASTATSYCWLVWIARDNDPLCTQTRFQWIPPCRANLERDEDYPQVAA